MNSPGRYYAGIIAGFGLIGFAVSINKMKLTRSDRDYKEAAIQVLLKNNPELRRG